MITAVQISQLFQSAIVFGTVIMFGALGEILTQKSGNLNLGVPGIMYLGGRLTRGLKTLSITALKHSGSKTTALPLYVMNSILMVER